MITRIDANNVDKYSVFFNSVSTETNSIGSLNEYFGQLHDLIKGKENDPEIIKYLKLPLDEDYLAIDANTRRINIPANFSRNGIGVVGDNTAEVVYFSVDRYFDAIDLGGDDVNIVIQWKTSTAEGLSARFGKIIEYFDQNGNLISFDQNGNLISSLTEDQQNNLKAIQQKVIFGWAIDDRMTDAAGRINFAVHFIKKSADNKIIYAFNTLPADLIVNSTLKLEDAQSDALDLTGQLLSRITSEGIYNLADGIPGFPKFTDKLKAIEVYREVGEDEGAYNFNPTTKIMTKETGDYDKVESGAILENGLELNLQDGDIVILRTKATSDKESDTLIYEWKHGDVVLSGGRYVYTPVSSTSSLSITAPNTYFYKNDDGKYIAFPYMGNFAVSATHTTTFNSETYELYTRQENIAPETGTARIEDGYAIYVLEYDEDDGAYIGNYTANVSAYAGHNSKTNNGNDVVVIPGPSDFVISPASGFTPENNVCHVLLNSTTATLGVSVTNANGDVSYQWKADDVNISGATTANYVVSSTADDFDVSYQCEVINRKHGKSTSATSGGFTFRVTQPASAPAIKIGNSDVSFVYDSSTTITDNIIERQISFGSMSSIDLKVSVPLADENLLHYSLIRENIPSGETEDAIRHTITLINTDLDDLGITASSQVGIISSPFETNTTDKIVIFNQSVTNNSTITLGKEAFTASPAYYRLIVKNEVNNDVNYSVSGLIHIVNG